MFCKNCGNQTVGVAQLCPDCEAKAQEELKQKQAHDEWRAQMAQRIGQRSSTTNTVQARPQTAASTFCTNCGAKNDGGSAFCSSCGAKLITEAPKPTTSAKAPTKNDRAKQRPGVSCPKCGSHNIDIQIHQENHGSKTITKTKSKYRQKRHGIFWWLLIGWWWIPIDLIIWVLFFPIRAVIQLLKKKDYKGKSKSVTTTTNDITYRTVHLCKDCGMHWES